MFRPRNPPAKETANVWALDIPVKETTKPNMKSPQPLHLYALQGLGIRSVVGKVDLGIYVIIDSASFTEAEPEKVGTIYDRGGGGGSGAWGTVSGPHTTLASLLGLYWVALVTWV
jgi:hypothetical protein